MKKFRVVFIILMFLGLSAFTARSEGKKMSAFEFMSRFNPSYAKQMSAAEKGVPITDIKAQGQSLAFRYKGVYLRFDFVGTEDVYIRLNGIAFSEQEVKHSNIFKKAVLTKFGLRLKNKQAKISQSLRSFASETTVSPLGEQSYEAPEPRTFHVPEDTNTGDWGGVGEDQEEEDDEANAANRVDFSDSFETTEYRLFSEDAEEPSTNYMRNRRQEMQLAFEMISGDNQAGMLNFVNGWMGGLNNMLANPNSPMDTFMRSGSQNPNSIEMPRYY